MAVLNKTFQHREDTSLFSKQMLIILDWTYIKGNNEPSQLASSSNYPDPVQRRQTEVPKFLYFSSFLSFVEGFCFRTEVPKFLYFQPFLSFAEGFGFRTKENTLQRIP